METDEPTVTVSVSDLRKLILIAADWTIRDEAAWERMWRAAGFEKDPQGYVCGVQPDLKRTRKDESLF